MNKLLLAVLAAPLWAQSPWTVLFDGQSGQGWRAPVTASFPEVCWRIEEGAFRPVQQPPSRLDLWTAKSYRNFVLEFEFKVAPMANGGIKYLIQRGGASRRREGKAIPVDTAPATGDQYREGTAGLEYQIVDDAGQEAQDPKRRSAALYSLLAPKDPPPVGPGVFHQGKVLVQGDHIEHWLDGRKVIDVTLGSPEMDAAWEASKRTDIKGLKPLPKRETPIAITHHGSEVVYRNLRIQELP